MSFVFITIKVSFKLPGMLYRIINFSYELTVDVNLLKPTGHVMHHKFNIQQLYTLPTLYLCVLYLSEKKQ
jgi:hypothetical protein